MNPIRFITNAVPPPSPRQVLTLFDRAGINFPQWTEERMQRALEGSAVVVCAWQDSELVGFARAISDRAWSAYLTQLAVTPEWQKQGIGKQLVERVLSDLGDEVALLVHSAEAATGFYEAIGFEAYANVYRIKRRR